MLMLAFVAWAAVYLYQHPENLMALRSISAGSLVLLAGLALLKLAAMGMFTWINLDALGIRLRFGEWFGLSAMTAMGNYLIAFRGGAAIRGVYLKSKYHFPYSLFLSTVASLYLLTNTPKASFSPLRHLFTKRSSSSIIGIPSLCF